MDIQQHILQLQKQHKECKEFFDRQAPVIVGVEAVKFYKKSFHDEGFTNASLEKWKEVKRRENPKRPDRAAASRKILTGETSDLGRSIEYIPSPELVIIRSDTTKSGSKKSYAAAHNEGTTTAGRNRNITIPKRQFIGESVTLNKIIIEKLNQKLQLFLNK